MGAGKMVQWSRVLIILPEDLSSVPSTHTGWLTTTYNSALGIYHPFLAFIGTLIHGTYIHTGT